MAKSKLYSEVVRALNELDAALVDVQQNIQCRLPVSDTQKTRLSHAFINLSCAAADMSTHLENLKRREETPTAADRIRNLKGIIKSKEELKKQRADLRQYFDRMKHQIDTLTAKAQQELAKISAHNAGLAAATARV